MKRTSGDRTSSPPRTPPENTARTSAALLRRHPSEAYFVDPEPVPPAGQQPVPALDVPPATHATPATTWITTLSQQLDHITMPTSAIAVVNSLSPQDFAGDLEQLSALLARLLFVTRGDPVLQTRLIVQLKGLAAASPQALRCIDQCARTGPVLQPQQQTTPAAQTNTLVSGAAGWPADHAPLPPGEWSIVLDLPVLPQPSGDQLVALDPQHGVRVPAHLQPAHQAPAQRRLDREVPVPAGWPLELTLRILNLNAPPIALQEILPDNTIAEMASPHNVPARLSKRFRDACHYQPTLAMLKWNHHLSQRVVFYEPTDDEGDDYEAMVTQALNSDVHQLVVELEHQPADAGSRVFNTLALLFSHPAGFAQLYQRLCLIRASCNGHPPAHLDFEHLPEHALFAAVTLLDPEGEIYEAVFRNLLTTLPGFPASVQATVLTGMWAHCLGFDPEDSQALLDELKTIAMPAEREEQLKRFIALYQALSDALHSPANVAAEKLAALPLGALLQLLESIDMGTGMQAALLDRLTVLHLCQPFTGSDLARLQKALSDHLKLLLKYTHPKTVSTTAAGAEIRHFDTGLLAQVFLKWSVEEQLHLLNRLELGEALELVERLLRDPGDAGQTATLRRALEALATADGLAMEVKGYIAQRLRR